MTNYTKGPWFAGDEQFHGTEVTGPFGIILAWCGQATITTRDGYYSIESCEANANARLIAAAPELLEALMLCREHMYVHASNTDDGAFDALVKAIAKATGGQQ